MTPKGGESDPERRGERAARLDPGGVPECCSDLSDAARWARACHPAYANRIRFPTRPGDPPASVE